MASNFIEEGEIKPRPTESDHITVFNFERLHDKPTVCLNILGDWSAMAANNKYLLYCPKGGLCLIDEQGQEHLNLKRDFDVTDICWSSQLNHFLILPDRSTTLYSLDIASDTTQQLKQIKEFSKWMWSCTSYMNTLIVSSYGKGSYIEEYDMTNWKLIKTIKPPGSDKPNQYIYKIRFNTNGSCLGIIQREGELHNWHYWFELRDRCDMKILHIVQLKGSSNGLLSFPNQQFLVNAWKDKGLLLIDPVGQRTQAIAYDAAVDATALIDEKCLVIQTTKPSQLRLYHL